MQLVLPKGKVIAVNTAFLSSLNGHIAKVLMILMMEVTVNQQNFIVSEDCSVNQLLENVLKISVKGVAVAINQNIVPKTDWNTYFLHPQDQVMLIKATQGG